MADAEFGNGGGFDLNDPQQRRKLYIAAAAVGGGVGLYLLWLKRRGGAAYDIVPVQTGQVSAESGVSSGGEWGEYLTELQSNLDQLTEGLSAQLGQQQQETQAAMDALATQFADALGGVYEYIQGLWSYGDYGGDGTYGYSGPLGERTSPAPELETKTGGGMTWADFAERLFAPALKAAGEGVGEWFRRLPAQQPGREERTTPAIVGPTRSPFPPPRPPTATDIKPRRTTFPWLERVAGQLRIFRAAEARLKPPPTPTAIVGPARSPFPAPRPPTATRPGSTQFRPRQATTQEQMRMAEQLRTFRSVDARMKQQPKPNPEVRVGRTGSRRGGYQPAP